MAKFVMAGIALAGFVFGYSLIGFKEKPKFFFREESVQRVSPPKDKIFCEGDHGFDSEEMFGQIWWPDQMLQVEGYVAQQATKAIQEGISFGRFQRPGFTVSVHPGEEDFSIAYGDFDGDGRTDALAYMDANDERYYRNMIVVWFGGEDRPRSLKDFRVISPRKGVQFTDNNIEKAFSIKTDCKDSLATAVPESEYAKAREDRLLPYHTHPNNNESDGLTIFFKEQCQSASAPNMVVRGNVNTFELSRSVVSRNVCGTLSQSLYIFSKSRDSVMIAEASTM